MPRLFVEYRRHRLAQLAQLQAPAWAQGGHGADVAAQAIDLGMQAAQIVGGPLQRNLPDLATLLQQEHQPAARLQQGQAVAALLEEALGGQPRGGLQQFLVHGQTSPNTSSKRFSASSMMSSVSAALVYRRLPARVTRQWAI